MRVIDTAAFGNKETTLRTTVAFLSSLCGMIVVATLIGLFALLSESPLISIHPSTPHDRLLTVVDFVILHRFGVVDDARAV